VNPEPPRNVTLRLNGDVVPVELRYDGLRWNTQAGAMLHKWTAVTRYPRPDEFTPFELTADVLPAHTEIYLAFDG